MTTFRIVLQPQLSAEEAWRQILNLHAHSALIPLTQVTGTDLTAPELRKGSVFVGRRQS